MEERKFDPIKGTFPNPKTIQCKDCANRDKTTVTVGKKKIATGVTKDYCDVYPKDGDGKPMGVLFGYERCVYYEPE